ncbi:MAG: MaoC family dehydratase [Anaerovoracaceae bacterium]
MSVYIIGQRASLSKKFTTEDVETFARISTDCNPVHLDDNYASFSIFGKKIVHGFLSASLISALIANKLPGPGSIYLSQELKFLKPVYHNDVIVAEVEIVDINHEKSIYILNTKCYVNNQIVIDGRAIIKWNRV